MSPIRVLSIILLSLTAVFSIAVSILMNQGAMHMFNAWSDLCALLFGLLCAAMAIMAAYEESNIERNYRAYQRMVQLDQHLWDTTHNTKALQALERQ